TIESSMASGIAFFPSPRGPEPPPEAPYVHRPQSFHPRRGGGVKGGVAAARSAGTLDTAEHRGLLAGRWTPHSRRSPRSWCSERLAFKSTKSRFLCPRGGRDEIVVPRRRDRCGIGRA